MSSIWGDIPTWLTAIGTIGAVAVSLSLATREDRRRVQRERRQQAELVTAWLGEEVPGGEHDLYQVVVIRNASTQSVYQVIASLVSIQGAFRQTAVPDRESRTKRGQVIRFQRTVGQVPPREYETRIQSGGHGMHLKLGVEIAFQDAAGVYWLRHGDGRLKEVHEDPVTLYNLMRPVGWELG